MSMELLDEVCGLPELGDGVKVADSDTPRHMVRAKGVAALTASARLGQRH